MRILHTSDWHLGHALHGLSREHEHDAFLRWLLHTLADEQVDVMLISGDVFDTANPSAQAVASWYRFLSQAVGQDPCLQIVVTAGNHDSPARLEAPHPILEPMRVHVVGRPRGPDGELRIDRMVVPLRDRRGGIEAWCAAVPFLRPGDLGPGRAGTGQAPPVDNEQDPQVDTGQDPLIEGVHRVYQQVLQELRARRTDDQQPILVMGHCYMTGATTSELSERKILGGNQHALPIDLFPEDVAYAALGHLHLAQAVGDRRHLRYAGSPIPLSLAEATYRHQVCLVDLQPGAAHGQGLEVQIREVPRTVEILRLPKQGALPLDNALKRLAELPPTEEYLDPQTRPYLEVTVKVDEPRPDLREQIEKALEGRAPRLLKLSLEHRGPGRALADTSPVRTLAELTPEQVFQSLYRKDHDGRSPEPALLAAFHELLDHVGQEGGP